MKNFTIILFIFFILFLALYVFTLDEDIAKFYLFISIFLGFVTSIICMMKYLGWIKGLVFAFIYLIAPFLIEYFLFTLNSVFFKTPLISELSLESFYMPITLNTLFMIFSIPLLFYSSLFFAQKIRLYTHIKKGFKTILVIFSSLLVAITFLNISAAQLDYYGFIKWLIIALIINTILSISFKFKIKTPDIYKELPIILYLAVYGMQSLKDIDTFSLLAVMILAVIYIIIIYHEHHLKKINQA